MRSYPALRLSHPSPPDGFADRAAAVLDDFGVIAIDEAGAGTTVIAYVADGRARPAATAALLRALPGTHVESIEVPDENWAARSQAALRSIQAGAIIVSPPWDVPADAGSTVVVIVPSMGFGTGHHATTRLCLEALQAIPVRGKAILDAGTGSGVLAIAAARLGAARVVAIDTDRDALENAAENAALNQTPIDLRCTSVDDPALAAGAFDTVLANLTGAALIDFAPVLTALTRAGGTLIVSGLREDEEAAVVNAFAGLGVDSRQADDGWVCVILRRATRTDL